MLFSTQDNSNSGEHAAPAPADLTHISKTRNFAADPIFKAIEAHRTAYSQLEDYCSRSADLACDNAQRTSIEDAEERAAANLLIEPSTVAGVISLLRYFAATGKYGPLVDSCWDVNGERFPLLLASKIADALAGC